MKYNLVLFLIIQLFTPLCIATDQPLFVSTIYGDFNITEPVLIELFNHPIMERIKHIHQYGTADYIIKQKKEYTRYEHCVGVWALLKMYGANLEEQIAGLLHDTSHTVFSHVGDVLFEHTSLTSSYQDDIHEWFLKQYHIDELLHKYDIPLSAVIHKSGDHTMLEQDLPNICADRLEYNIQAGILTNMLAADDIATILKDINYNNGNWFFMNENCAKKFAAVSLFNTEHVWASPADQIIYQFTAHALKRGLDIGLLTFDDIHFSTDPIVWDKLWISNDPYIVECIENIINYKKLLNNPSQAQQKNKKFRGINPWIYKNNQLQRLTDLDNEFKEEYNHVKTKVAYKI